MPLVHRGERRRVPVRLGGRTEFRERQPPPPQVHPERVDVEAVAGEPLGRLQQAPVRGGEVGDRDRLPDEHHERAVTTERVPDGEHERVGEADEHRVREDGEREDAQRRPDERQHLTREEEPGELREEEREDHDGLGVGAAEAAEPPEHVAERRDEAETHDEVDEEQPLAERVGVQHRTHVHDEQEDAQRDQREPRLVRHATGGDVAVRRPPEHRDREQSEQVRQRTRQQRLHDRHGLHRPTGRATLQEVSVARGFDRWWSRLWCRPVGCSSVATILDTALRRSSQPFTSLAHRG